MPRFIRVSLAFTYADDHDLETLAGAVILGMTGNNYFPSPPVAVEDLEQALAEFTAAVAAQPGSGKLGTSNKHDKRHKLISLLRTLAVYVQENCDHDPEKLLSTGFQLSGHGHHPQVPSPLKLDIPYVANGKSGELLVSVKSTPNMKSFEVRRAAQNEDGSQGPWQSRVYTTARSMPLTGLKPGTVYTIQVRAIGTSNRPTDWSDPVSHMSL
jgi:hypothetical protein